MSDHSSRFMSSLAASGVAEVVTLPIDVAKVRLQVQHVDAGPPKYTGMVSCIRTTAAEEGAGALWKGLAPSLVRQCCYSSMSLVLYEPIRDSIVDFTGGLGEDGQANYLQRLLSGGTAGAVSITMFNWTEVLKVRMQQSTGNLTMGSVFRQVLAQDGAIGFMAGLQPNVVRTFLVNAAELGTYDQAKASLVPYVGDNAAAHLGASTISGICSAAVSTPADVVKTRLQGGQDHYKGVFDAVTKISRDEGLTAFYKGVIPICVRKVIWCSTFFVLYEQLRKMSNKHVLSLSR